LGDHPNVADEDTPESERLASALRVFRAVDAACALLLIVAVAYSYLSGENIFERVIDMRTVHTALGSLATTALPWVIIGVIHALCAFVLFPRRARRRLALPIGAIAVAGYMLVACTVFVPWATNAGLWPFLLGVGLIGGGATAHAVLAWWCWRSESPA
jgi:hypothetical protein